MLNSTRAVLDQALAAGVIRQSEMDLIGAYIEREMRKDRRTVEISKIERQSPRDFDLSFEGQMTEDDGKKPFSYNYSAGLVTAVIRASNWPRFAQMSDYPQMVWAGDWSGIRDSSMEAKWEMFEIAKDEITVKA